MSDKHTPGPWKVDGLDVLLKQDGDREVWCRLHGSQNYYANARLIAAAPEMLEALRCCVSWLDNVDPYYREAVCEVIRDANAAIAKATGEKEED